MFLCVICIPISIKDSELDGEEPSVPVAIMGPTKRIESTMLTDYKARARVSRWIINKLQPVKRRRSAVDPAPTLSRSQRPPQADPNWLIKHSVNAAIAIPSAAATITWDWVVCLLGLFLFFLFIPTECKSCPENLSLVLRHNWCRYNNSLVSGRGTGSDSFGR